MPAATLPQNRTISFGLPAALLLHAIALALLFLLPRPAPLEQPPENSIEVEFVAEIPKPAAPAPQPPALPARPQAQEPSAESVPQEGARPPRPSEALPPPPPPAMIQARKILSDLALADPRSRQARKMLPLLGRDERMEQLCNIEAMAQLRAWNHELEPDLTIAYARAETKTADAGVTADGAAFRSRKQWFALKYRCDLTADLAKVSAFAFQAGSTIPRKDWGRFNLPVSDKPQD
ncbi:hypothetical protein BA190_26410 [Labrys sp. WJW]|uniref:DUF930 domain-containing protein n=1 Tax=Labrys sp. WJW TaxID=1737983 RepID=UPI00082C139B|nr:DUF930 domain-containing protein [Labrys sp. WJW]OCC01926.1 hypothetical protein BA190_26410 [Labrys sp. WJW]